MTLLRTLILTLLASLFFAGCGGGGGGGTAGDGVGPNLPVGGNQNNNPAPAGVQASIQGQVAFPVQTSNSILKSFSRLHFAVQKVSLGKSTKSPISQVTVQMYVSVNRQDGLGNQRILQLGNAVTDSSGKYNLQILQIKLPELAAATNNEVRTLKELYQSDKYRVELSLDRPSAGGLPGISKKIRFTPSYNKRLVGGGDQEDLTINATLDFNNDQSLKLEVVSTPELKEWEERLAQYRITRPSDWDPDEWDADQLTERIVIQEAVDINGNGIPDEDVPLVVFEKPQIENNAPKIVNRKIVRVFEIDANNDGNFAEGDDLVAASVFGGTGGADVRVASFVDLESDGNINASSELAQSTLDIRRPFIEFVTPVTGQTVEGNLDIKVRFCDCAGFIGNSPTNVDLGFDISTLKVWFNKPVEFLTPSRFTLAAGADMAQVFFSKRSDGGTSGTASFTLPNVTFALGNEEFNNTMYASIKDFAGKEQVTSVNFIINGPPQIQSQSDYTVTEGSNAFSTQITIKDVDALNITIEPINGGSVPSYIYLTSAANPALQGPSLAGLVPQNGELKFTLNVIPGDDFGLEGSQVLLLKVSDGINTISKPITVRPQKSNTPSNFLGICWVNSRDIVNHPFSQNPQNVCTAIFDPGQVGTYCRTRSGYGTAATTEGVPLVIPEDESSRFVMCGSERDSEDVVQYSFESILTSQATTISTQVPAVNSEFFFNSPTNLSFVYNEPANSINPTSIRTQSTIGQFEWKPLGNTFPNQNKLSFRATDGKGVESCIDPNCVPSVPMSIILSVVTVPDPPEINSVSTLGLRTGTFPGTGVYSRPYVFNVNNNRDYFEQYRTVGLNPPVLFSAQQGEPIEIQFVATDDENPLNPQNTAAEAEDPVLILGAKPAWLSQSPAPVETNYRFLLTGTPTANDSLQTQNFTIRTVDPGAANARATTYTFSVNILDQNDKPWFDRSSSSALLPSPASTTPQEFTTLSINATEDQTLTFYIHAFDIDPVASPFYKPELFSFSYDNNTLNTLRTQPSAIQSVNYTQGASHRSAKIVWVPTTLDTGEDQPAGVAARKENKLFVVAEANCPTDVNLFPNCSRQTSIIDLRLNVLSVDEPAHFTGLFQDKAQVFETDGTQHKTRLLTLEEGRLVEIRQEALDEENQAIKDIKIKAADQSLSPFVSNQVVFKNPDASSPSFIRMTGAPTVVDYVDRSESSQGTRICSVPLWVQPQIQSVCAPQVVTMSLEVVNSIGTRGAETSELKLLRFSVVDKADPPIFVDPATHNSAVRISNSIVNRPLSGIQTPVATEDEAFILPLTAFNKVDKDPRYWDGFNFTLIQGPTPPGNISVESNLSNTTNTTAVLRWTPTQVHVEGTGAKQHEIVVRVCIRDPERFDPNQVILTACKDQTYRINVLPKDDPPTILFGDQQRNLATDPITQQNPFIVSEDSVFDRLIRVQDEDLQSVRVQMVVSLANIPGALPVSARAVGGQVAPTAETILPADFTPILSNGNDNFVDQRVTWSTIDWDDISAVSTSPRARATYILTIVGTTPDDSQATGRTQTSVYLELRSVNDIPSFTTTVLDPIKQSDGSTPATTRVTDLLDIVNNEEGDNLIITLVDKGTAADFLADLSANETGDRTRVLYLTNPPGQTGVGTHQLTIKVEEANNPENFTVSQITLPVLDSNDSPVWEANPLFSGKFPLQEGQSKSENLVAVDADLASAPGQERLTFTVFGGFKADLSDKILLYSNGQSLAATSNFAFTGTTAPVANGDNRAFFNFNFSPRLVSTANAFAVTDYYLQFLVTDTFRKDDPVQCFPQLPPCPNTTITTVAFEITPNDNTPSFTLANRQPVVTSSSISPICFNTATGCQAQDDFIVIESNTNFLPATFTVSASDQETEALSFLFTSLGANVSSTPGILSLTFSGTPFNIQTVNQGVNDSITMNFNPTNSNVGMQRFTLRVSDTGDSGATSRNTTRQSTRTFAMLVRNSADAPTLTSMKYKNASITNNSVQPIVLYEDSIENILIDIDDLDLYIPSGFTAQEQQILSQTYNLNPTAIAQITNYIMPKESFRYSLENLTTLPNFGIVEANSTQFVFGFSSPANLVLTSTTDVVKLSWTPSNNFTFPKIGGAGTVTLQLLVDSLSAKSVVASRASSLRTNIFVKVWPVNDRPRIVNTQVEALATQDSPFSFAVNGLDEEENTLTYGFVNTPPGDMAFNGNTILWNPSNADTTTNVYNLGIFARDTGKITDVSSAGLASTTALKSTTYNLKVFLNNVDDPAIRDGLVNPLTTTNEDELYVTNLRYTDPDFNDVLVYSFNVRPDQSMTIEDDNQDGTATIRWTPTLPGTFPITVRIDSKEGSNIRSTIFYSYNLTVNPKNDPPVFNSLPISNMLENQSYVYNIDVSDEDDSSTFLTLITTNLPGIQCADPNGVVSLFAADRKLQGLTRLQGLESSERNLVSTNSGIAQTIPICIEATDGENVTTQSFTLFIQVDNNPPTVMEMRYGTNPATPTILSQSDLLISSEPLVYKDRSTRIIDYSQALLNITTITFFDEEADLPITFEELQGPGLTISTPVTANANTARVSFTWTPDSSHVNNPPQIVVRARDNRNRQTDIQIQTRVLDTPEKPTCAFNKTKQFIDEDQTLAFNLNCTDPDTNSVLSFSIVTSVGTVPHPTNPILSANPYNNSQLELQVTNQGQVTFVPRISSPSVISVADEVPVTFSICGTSRSVASFQSDCTTVTYNYRIQARNDEPIFIPSIPTSVKTTAKEGSFAQGFGYRGGRSPGLTFRKVLSQGDCKPETSEEICIYDEESTSAANLYGTTLVNLSITSPAVTPSGLELSNPTPDCGVAASCLSTDKLSCSTVPVGCASARYSVLQTLTWDPIPFNQPSSLNLEITAKESQDSSKAGTFNFSLLISNTNRPPTINNGNPLVQEQLNESVTFQYNLGTLSSDPDNDPLNYNITAGVSGMTINTNTGLITWTPNASHIGDHLVRVSVRDNPSSGISYTVTSDLNLTVLRVNTPPIIEDGLRLVTDTSVVTQSTATEGLSFSARIFARDEEGDAFTFLPNLSKLNGQDLPATFELTASGRINWTPDNSNVGPNELLVVVRDTASGENSTKTFVITVKNVNQPPVISNPITTTQQVNEQDTFTYTFNINEPDSSDVPSFSVNVTPELAANITGQGVLTITPGPADAGTYLVTVGVGDTAGATDSNTFNFIVNQKNNPPTLEVVAAPLFVQRGQEYIYKLFASDPENDPISYAFVSKPNNVEINQANGELRITPLATANQTFQVFAQDSNGQQSTVRTVVINYTDVAPPTITSLPSKVGRVLTPYSYQVLSDAEAFTIIPVQLPDGMAVVGGVNALQWTPAFNPPDIDQSGVQTIIFRVQANVNQVDLQSAPQRFQLTISKENDPPVISYATDVNGQPIVEYDATQGITFAATVFKITDNNPEDLGLIDFNFLDTLSKQATSNPTSVALAQLNEVPGSRKVNTQGKAEVLIQMVWQPDNAAAFAVANGGVNRFVVSASDGISKNTTSLSLDFNVTNRNDSPKFFADENQGASEIAYVGQTYRRDFYARDEDNQFSYFCLDVSRFFKFGDVNQPPFYPSGTPIVQDGNNLALTRTNILAFEGDGNPIFQEGAVPSNQICVKGVDVNPAIDPNPSRGKLTKATLVWTLPSDFWIDKEPFENLPLTLWDQVFNNQSTGVENGFTLKLAPEITNLVPNIQYVGDEVAISGGGIVKNANQLIVKFIRSDGSISAVTEVYNLDENNPGQGTFRVPKGAVSGFVSVGFTSFSSAVPFTVLNGKTGLIAGSSNLDDASLSIPSGLAVTATSLTSNLVFISNLEYHTVNAYRWTNGQKPDSVGVIAGVTGRAGDASGNLGSNLLNEPTGLSIARYQNSTYVLIADTGNNKIKAVNIDELYQNPAPSSFTFPTYTIANSTSLNRPYKAVQHPSNLNHFYIANTFGNTIEFLYTGALSFANLPERDQNEAFFTKHGQFMLDVNTATGSKNTYTAAGTGASRVDHFGNVFHPTDLNFEPKAGGGFRLLVSNYTNYKYSYNPSYKIFTLNNSDRNLTNNQTGISNQPDNFSILGMDLGDYATGDSRFTGDVLQLAMSDRDTWVTSDGLTYANPTTTTPRTDKSYFIYSGADTFSKDAYLVSSEVIKEVQDTAVANLNRTTSSKALYYQTAELELTSPSNGVGFISVDNDAGNNNKAALFLQPGSREVSIVPIDANNTYSLNGSLITTLPNFGGGEIGEPTFYDTDQDGIADLWIPATDQGRVYVFKGEIGTPPGEPRLKYDTSKYWYMDSNSFGTSCGLENCLIGVRQVSFGRSLPTTNSTTPPFGINMPMLRGDDLILVNKTAATITIVDSYKWTPDGTRDGTLGTSLPTDMNFHINQSNANPPAYDRAPTTTGTYVDFSRGANDADPAYQFFQIELDSNPFEVCVGHYTMNYLTQQCLNQDAGALASSPPGVCPTDGNPVNGNVDTLVTFRVDSSTTPSFNDLKVDFINMEQMMVRYQPDQNGESQMKLVFFTANQTSGSLEVQKFDVSAKAGSRLRCGQPFSRSNQSLKSLQPIFGNPDRQAYIEFTDFAKKDSYFYITKQGQFQMFDWQDTEENHNYWASSAAVAFANEATDLQDGNARNFTSFSDFLLVDFTGDGVRDLVALHPTEQKISFRVGTGNPSGRLFSENTDLQVLDTLANPQSIDMIYTTTGVATNAVDIIVTNKDATSVSVFQHKTTDAATGNWYKEGVHFNLGNTGNIVNRSIQRSSQINILDNSVAANASKTTTGIAVWDGYYFGNPSGSFPFYATGIKESRISTVGIINLQNINGSAQLNSLNLVDGLIFRSGRSINVTTNPNHLRTYDLNLDLIDDIVTIDTFNKSFNVILSNDRAGGTTEISYDQNSITYKTEGLGFDVAFGDLDERLDNNPVGTRKRHPDLAIPNYDRDTISIFFNGGKSLDSNINPDYSFSHPAYPGTTISVGKGPVAATMADFDLDGHLDIAVANKIGNNVSVLYNNASNPGTFANPIFFSVGFSPVSVKAIKTRTHDQSSNAPFDLVVMNQSSESISVLLNKAKQGSPARGFQAARSVKIPEYYPPYLNLVDRNTQVQLDPFLDFPKMFDSGDYGSLTSQAYNHLVPQHVSRFGSIGTTHIVSEHIRYENLVVGYENMVYTMKNIGNKEYQGYQTAITDFSVGADASLSVASIRSLTTGVVKSIATSSGNLIFSKSLLSDDLFTGDSTSTSLYTTSMLMGLALNTQISASTLSVLDSIAPTNSAFDIRREQLGAGYEAMASFKTGTTTRVLAVHSGQDKGLVELISNGGTIQESYVLAQVRTQPSVTGDYGTKFASEVNFINPGGMALDPNRVSLLVADRGNSLIRVIDLQSNVTRVMKIRDANNPTVDSVVDLTNVTNTFNYFLIGSDRKLYLVNPSKSPISITTQSFDNSSVDFSQAPHSNLKWKSIESFGDNLYIGACDDPRTTCRVYKIDLTTLPYGVQELAGDFTGLNGFTLNSNGNRIFWSDANRYVIRYQDLNVAQSATTVTTLAGIDNLQGHFDGSNSIALLNQPGQMVLNAKQNELYFVDGSTIRSVNLELLQNGSELEVATVSGDPFRTGILNADGQRARFIRPAFLQYEFRNGKDLLYVSDELGNNIRSVSIDP